MPAHSSRRSGFGKKSLVIVLTCSAIAVIINISCVTISIYLLVQKSATKSQSPNTHRGYGEPIACVTCEPRKGDQLLEGLAKRMVDNVQYCCAHDSVGMSALLELAMRKPLIIQEDTILQATSDTNQNTIATANFSLSLASAHRQLLPAELFNSSLHDTPLFISNKTVPLKLIYGSLPASRLDHNHEVNVTRDGFHVIHTGVYYVYTNVKFKPDSSLPCRLFDFKTWEQEVLRRSEVTGERTIIMKSVHTCPDEQNRDKESSFTGGVFSLNKGDLLEVTSSGEGLLHFSPDASYFGLFMLGTGSGV